MKKQKRLPDGFCRLVPTYSHLPLLGVLLSNIAVYSITKMLTSSREHYSPETAIDAYIPFLPIFIFIYILSYVQWAFCYIITAGESRAVASRYLGGAICAKLLAGVIFMIFPTTMERPEVIGNGLWETLVELIYAADTPVNLFPSVHCLESWIAFRSALATKKLGRWYAPICLIFSLLVFASTVFVKQHCFIDIIGGIITAEAGILIWRGICHLREGRTNT